jgi:hypothetical protein
MSRSHRLLVPLALAVCLAQPAAALQIVADFVSGYVSFDGGGTQQPLIETSVTHPSGAQEVTASGLLSSLVGTPGSPSFFTEAGANGLAFAAPGVVRARVSTSATNASFVPNVPASGLAPVAQAGLQARLSGTA